MKQAKVLASVLVTDGWRVGEVWTTDESPYPQDNGAEAAYVVGQGFAAWILVSDLRPVGAVQELSHTA